MITISAKINLLNGYNDIVGLSGLSGNNISSGLSEILQTKEKASNPFIIGASKLGDGSTFSEKQNYFIGNVLSNDNGVFDNYLSVFISLQNVPHGIGIAFDTQNNRYCKNIHIRYIDEQHDLRTLRYTNSHSIFYTNLSLPSNISDMYIDFCDWSEPNYPLVLTGIYTYYDFVIDKRNMTSLDLGISVKDVSNFVSYGIISNTGNISFSDYDENLLSYIEQLGVKSDLKIPIEIKNTISKKGQSITCFNIDTIDYDTNNKVASLSLKDDLTEWQEISLPKRYATRAKTALQIYEEIKALTTNASSKWTFKQLDSATQSKLGNIPIPYPYFKESSLWNRWTKFCQLTHSYLYKDTDNDVRLFIHI